jgi:hypothetical protein
VKRVTSLVAETSLHSCSSTRGIISPGESEIQMFQFSQSAIEQVVNDMRTGKSDEFVKEFFASRPEWSEDDTASTQTDKEADKQEKAVKA